MKKCQMCSHDVSPGSLVCSECFTKVLSHEMPRREYVLYVWGKGLMVFLAIVFFVRGVYALMEPNSYRAVAAAVGMPLSSDTVHYLNTSVLLLAGMLYGISWIGTYLQKVWHQKLCLVTLVFFVAAQVILQLIEVVNAGDFALRLAVIIFWCVIPVFQYVALHLGEHFEHDQPSP
jgi:hypothetical protein